MYHLSVAFEHHPITAMADDSGVLWFFADEICDALGIEDHNQSTRYLDDDEKGVFTKQTPGGPQRKATINESGMYSLILRSRKPSAKKFKKWVTAEILPQIRRTGSYGQPSASTQALAALVRDAVREALAEERREYPVALLATLNHHGHQGHQAVTKPQKPTVPSWIVEAVAERLEEDDDGAMTYADLCPVLGPGRVWTKSDKVWLGKHLAERQFGERVRHGNIRAFCVRVKRRGPRLVA